MKKKETTITDLARLLKLNVSTVSRALQGHSRISEETRMKVQKAAAKYKYEPNTFATGLRSGKSHLIGIIVPRINRFFFSNVIGGIERTANRNGFQTIICQTNESFEQEAECVNALIKSRVDGIIISLSAGTTSFSHLKKITAKKIPLVMFDRICESIPSTSVTIDDYMGAFNAVEHLIETGCREIVHLGGPQHLNIYKNRYRGYLDALKKNNIPVNPKLLSFDSLTREKGITEMEKMLPLKPDGVFAASDFSALGAYEYLTKNKYSIPDDIAIVGFANEPFTEIMGLSSVEQHPEEMGEKAAELFFYELNRSGKKKTHDKVITEPKLIIRQSSDKGKSRKNIFSFFR